DSDAEAPKAPSRRRVAGALLEDGKVPATPKKAPTRKKAPLEVPEDLDSDAEAPKAPSRRRVAGASGEGA
ncbi:MAG TPA: hypothetical protein PL162_04310, partial [Synergistaceae bacterium]|nr:hypothetical protein [Synergistaceae bacterium]